MAEWLPVFCLFMSVGTFFLCGADKRRAVLHRRRVPERVLLALSFAGGAAGMLFGMLFFHHKTRHFVFAFWVPLLFLAQMLLLLLSGGFLFR